VLKFGENTKISRMLRWEIGRWIRSLS
jgi:hypothetical protein